MFFIWNFLHFLLRNWRFFYFYRKGVGSHAGHLKTRSRKLTIKMSKKQKSQSRSEIKKPPYGAKVKNQKLQSHLIAKKLCHLIKKLFIKFGKIDGTAFLNFVHNVVLTIFVLIFVDV